MRQRRKAGPPTRVASRASRPIYGELTSKASEKKRSAKKRSTLDGRFYRTYLPLTREDPRGRTAQSATILTRVFVGSNGELAGGHSTASAQEQFSLVRSRRREISCLLANLSERSVARRPGVKAEGLIFQCTNSRRVSRS